MMDKELLLNNVFNEWFDLMICKLDACNTTVTQYTQDTAQVIDVLAKLPRYESFEKQLAEKANACIDNGNVYLVTLFSGKSFAVSFHNNVMYLGIGLHWMS